MGHAARGLNNGISDYPKTDANMQLPQHKRTFELYERLGKLTSYGRIAQISGVTTDTADDWARAPESDDNPFGTGKKNTTDTVLRQIALAHGKDAGFARKWAETFPAYVDYLDELKGEKRIVCDHAPLCKIIGEAAKEQMDIVVEFMNAETIDYERLETEILESLSKTKELLACVRESAKKQIEERTFEAAVN